MSIAASFLITCILFTGQAGSNSPTYERLVDSEVVKWTKTNKDCWESGGTPLLMCTDAACTDKGSLRNGVVKLAQDKNQKLSAYNFGYQFASLKNGNPPKLSDSINDALKDEMDAVKKPKTVYLEFKEKNEEWVLKPRDEKLGGCGVVHEMNCLQAVILTNESDFRRFDAMGCREIRGDLIINNFRFTAHGDYSALDRLERITGRLIIHGSVGDVNLKFNNLTELKSRDFSVVEPILQITKNTVNSISFPKLETVGSGLQKQTSNTLVVIGENVGYGSNRRMTNISVKGKRLNTAFVADKMVKRKPREKKEEFVFKEGMTEKDLQKKNVPYVINNNHEDVFKDHGFVYAVPCVLPFLAALGLIFYSMKFQKKPNFDYDLNAIPEKDPDEDSKDESSHKK